MEWNAVQNTQQNTPIDQSKLQGFKVINYIQYLGHYLTKILITIHFFRKKYLLKTYAHLNGQLPRLIT